MGTQPRPLMTGGGHADLKAVHRKPLQFLLFCNLAITVLHTSVLTRI